MTERRLPVKQLVIIAICRFSEPIAFTSVLPYIPEFIQSFGVPENDIARWAGITSAIFSLCQASTGILWGAASDRFGRKPIILIGLVNTMITMLIWGFSTSLPMAIAARALQGLGNGNAGIPKTMVAELCPWKELQPRAFSIMPLVYSIGAVFGPTIGGTLSNPLRVDVTKPRGNRFLERYPFILPNLVAASFFAVSIVIGFLFLKETLETKKYERDYGLVIGAKVIAWVQKTFNTLRGQKKTRPEREPLLGSRNGNPEEEIAPCPTSTYAIISDKRPGLRDVLSYQTTLNLIVYTSLALYTIAYDQILPVFMHHPTQSIDDPNISLPLKFASGFGIKSAEIGMIFTFFSFSTTLCQILVFPPVARKLGILPCLRIAFLIFPFIFFITPYTALHPDPTVRQVMMIVLLMVRGLAGTFAFPTATIMLTNSAASLEILGTLNGLATSVSAIGRAVGPASVGGLFTYGVKRGYIIVPFWGLCAFGLIASIPTWWLEEGKGFGDDPDPDFDSVVPATQSLAESGDDQRQPDGDAVVASQSESESEHIQSTKLRSSTSTDAVLR